MTPPLRPSRALVADAEDPRDMGAAAQRLDLVDRLQFGDDADDLAGADIENRQDRALACGERLQARRQTLTRETRRVDPLAAHFLLS